MIEQVIEERVVGELQEILNSGIERRVRPAETRISEIEKMQKAIIERLAARGPGFSGAPQFETSGVSLARQIADDGSFQAWMKSSKLPSSGYACELRLPPSRSAKATVSGVSPTESIGAIYGPAAFPLRLRSLLPKLTVTSANIEYVQETAFTPNAAVVPETTLKPAMTATYAPANAKVATIANTIKASVQALGDVPTLQVWLDNRLMYSVALKEEDVILNGDATNSITGLMAAAPAFVYTPLATDNAMDVVARAAGALQGAGYQVDGVVMNSDDYTGARLLKSTTGTYLFMGGGSTGPDDESVWESTPLMWQVPMVISPSMPKGEFLIGAFAQSTILFSRETLNVQVAFQNEDDFVRNLVTLRGELRSGIAVPVPAGLLKGSFTGITGASASASKR